MGKVIPDSERKQCSIEDCERPVNARGWCSYHYGRWFATGDPLGERRGTPVDGHRVNFECSIEDCHEPAIAKGWCSRHHYCWYYHGDPLWVIPPRNCKRCGREFTPEKDTRKQICDLCKVSTLSLSRQSELHLPKGQYIAIIQDSVCGICGLGAEQGLKMVVDHDHLTGMIREPLCMAHNSGIGFFNDDPEMLRRAAEYIERHKDITNALEETA